MDVDESADYEPSVSPSDERKAKGKNTDPVSWRQRTTKTPLQKEVLEASYTLNPFPSEEHRKALGERIGLTEQQVQVWFTNRRRKEKKPNKGDGENDEVLEPLPIKNKTPNLAPALKLSAKQASILYRNATKEAAIVASQPAPTLTSQVSNKKLVATQTREKKTPGRKPASLKIAPKVPVLPQPIIKEADVEIEKNNRNNDEDDEETEEEEEIALAREYETLIEAAKQSLPVHFIPDGPPLSFEFDDIPMPGRKKRGEGSGTKRKRGGGHFKIDDGSHKRLSGQTGNRHFERSDSGQIELPKAGKHSADEEKKRQMKEEEKLLKLQEKQHRDLQKEQERLRKEAAKQQERAERERRREEEEKAKEVERQEKERRKQQERVDREAAREAQRREQQRVREEERLRQAAEREAKKVEVLRERERKTEEKRRQVEEKRREREAQRLAVAAERLARMKAAREAGGPPDDEDLEMTRLLEEAHEEGYASDTQGTLSRQERSIVRPDFPPASILHPAFPAELGEVAGGDVLTIVSFLDSFASELGLPSLGVEDVLRVLSRAQDSNLLAGLHITLLRHLQADLEEAAALGAAQAGVFISERLGAATSCANLLEAALLAGYDVDSWRAHLNALTWPEVLRQVGTVLGGSRQSHPRCIRDTHVKVGCEFEDVSHEDAQTLTLRMPHRFGHASLKEKIWCMLSAAGLQGRSCADICRALAQGPAGGPGVLSYSRLPEASVASALASDVLFCKTHAGTYALHSIAQFHDRRRKMMSKLAQVGVGTSLSAKPVDMEVDENSMSGGAHPEGFVIKCEVNMKSQESLAEGGHADSAHSRGHSEALEETTQDALKADKTCTDEELFVEVQGTGYEAQRYSLTTAAGSYRGAVASSSQEEDSWVHALALGDYFSLSLEQRIAALAFLCNALVDGPTLRSAIDSRVDVVFRVRKQATEDAKTERKRRQDELSSRIHAASEEAMRLFEEARACVDSGGEIQLSTPDPEDDEQAAREMVGLMFEQRIEELLDGDAAAAVQMAAELITGSFRTETEEAVELERQQRAEVVQKAESANIIRSEPLGLDRRHNKYWNFALQSTPSTSRSDGKGQRSDGIFIEMARDMSWRLLYSLDHLTRLRSNLDSRGLREGLLNTALGNYIDSKGAVIAGAPLTLPETDLNMSSVPSEWLHKAQPLAITMVNSAEDYVADMDLGCMESPALCKIKADLLHVESALPPDAVDDAFHRYNWMGRVQAAQTAAELRSCLGQLEAALSPAYVSALFARQPPATKVAAAEVAVQGQAGTSADAQAPAAGAEAGPSSAPEPLCWLPPTVAALALRLAVLDAAIIYRTGFCGRDVLAGYRYMLRPTALGRPPDPPSYTCGPPLSNGCRVKVSAHMPLPLSSTLSGPPRDYECPLDLLRGGAGEGDDDDEEDDEDEEEEEEQAAGNWSVGPGRGRGSIRGRGPTGGGLARADMLGREGSSSLGPSTVWSGALPNSAAASPLAVLPHATISHKLQSTEHPHFQVQNR